MLRVMLRVMLSLGPIEMLNRLLSFFRRPALPTVRYEHPEFGVFGFVPGIGWAKVVDFSGRDVRLYLGSDGELPNQEMIDCLQYWLSNWERRRTEITDYISDECKSWPPDDIGPDVNQLVVSSIEILWPEKPWSCTMYFDAQEDDERQFHVSFDKLVPICFAYDH